MKILVRGTNWIGDAVMSIPALRELRRIFPDAKITLLTRAWADGLFRDATFIDEIVTFEKDRWAAKDVYKNSQFLRDDKFDLAVLLPNSFESALTTFLTRIPRRIGYNKDVRGLLLTDPIAVPEWKNRRHEVFYYLQLVAEIERRMLDRETVLQSEPDVTLEVSRTRKTAARELLAKHGVDLSKKIIALGAGSTNSLAKRWPAENFARLADLIADSFDANVILLGSPDEAEIARTVVSSAKAAVIDLVGRTQLDEAVGVLSVVDLMISNDMGLAHVAPSVGTPTIAVFGPTNPETTRPFSPNAIVVRGDDSTWPSVDEIFNAAEEFLTQRREDREDAKEEKIIF